MSDRLVPLFGILAMGALAVVAYVLYRFAERRREAEEVKAREEREKHVLEGIARGILKRDSVTGRVHSCCVVCGDKAVDYAPMSGVSWMDRLPLLNRLHSLAPRYTIDDNEDAGFQLCKIHRQVAVKKLEEFHALLRAERAKFNSGQEDKVAHMDGGALVRGLKEYHRSTLPEIEEPVVKQLPPAKDSSPMTIVTSSSTKAEAGDEDEDENVA